MSVNRLFWLAAVILALLLALAVTSKPASAGDSDGVIYRNGFGGSVSRFTDGDLICYVIFAQRDGDHTVFQCYKQER